MYARVRTHTHTYTHTEIQEGKSIPRATLQARHVKKCTGGREKPVHDISHIRHKNTVILAPNTMALDSEFCLSIYRGL